MRTIAHVASVIAVVFPMAAQAANTSVQSEAPLSAGVLLAGTALVALAVFLRRRKA